MNKVSLTCRKKLTVFVANDKSQAFKQKCEFWKNVSQYLKEIKEAYFLPAKQY